VPRRFDCFMFRDELDMLEMRLHELDGKVDLHVLVECATTHRGIAKPLAFQENLERFAPWLDRIVHVIAEPEPGLEPWGVEHAQRDAAWLGVVGEGAGDSDVLLICDVDELPSAAALAWSGHGAVSLWMRTTLYAVDWEVPSTYPLPPTAVAATAGFVREHGGRLGEVRDQRGTYPMLHDGGWHFSWTGGPERTRQKLLTSTCHTELLSHPEAELILSGARYREGADGGGIPVVPVDVDETWPAWIRERKCPPEWFRPR
jgi:hypothetical protein